MLLGFFTTTVIRAAPLPLEIRRSGFRHVYSLNVRVFTLNSEDRGLILGRDFLATCLTMPFVGKTKCMNLGYDNRNGE